MLRCLTSKSQRESSEIKGVDNERDRDLITRVIEIFTGCTLSTTAADFFNGLAKSRENQNLVRFLETLDYRCLLCRLNVQSKAQNLFEKSFSLLKNSVNVRLEIVLGGN